MKKREERIPMSILEQIRADSVSARKSGDKLKSGLLVTLLSEAQSVGKNANRETTDEETIAVIKKFIKNAEETSRNALASVQTNKMDAVQKSADEVKILSSYLPKQLTEDEIKIIISGLKAGEIMEPSMKNIMAYFKEMYAGRYDGAMVAKYAK